MITLSLLSTLIWWPSSPQSAGGAFLADHTTPKKEAVASAPAPKPAESAYPFNEATVEPAGTTPAAGPDSLTASKQGTVQRRVVVRQVWVPDEYEYVTLPRQKNMGFWIGMHYTMQQAQFDMPWDSTGDMKKNSGFNIQFMSGDIMRNRNWAAYGGLDFGMQFYGRGPNSNVVLNTVNEDSGYTRLRSSSMDFLIRGHWEYARYALVPYVNLMAGPRIYMTGQKVASYLTLKDNESSSSHNVNASASLLYGAGIGLRLKIARSVSLDARYEMLWGTPVKIVDMRSSSFNGLNYDLRKQEIEPVYSQFKAGIIFDLYTSKTESRLKKPGYYREEVIDNLYLDPKDSTLKFQNCPCDPNDSTPRRVPQRTPQNGTTMPMPQSLPPSSTTPDTSTPSNSNNSNKSSFPGIKTNPTPPAPPVRKPEPQH